MISDTSNRSTTVNCCAVSGECRKQKHKHAAGSTLMKKSNMVPNIMKCILDASLFCECFIYSQQ